MMHLKRLAVVSHLSAFTRLLLLLALIACLLVAATLMEHALRTIAASEVEAIAYKQVLVVLAEEQTLEYEYVLHPSPALRNEQLVKATTFSRLVQNLQQDADTGDDVFGDHILTQQAAYISSIHRSFAAADAGDVTRANSIRNTSVTPLFRQIEQELIRQSNIQEALSAQNVAQLTQIQQAMFVATPLLLVIGLLLLGLSQIVQKGYRRTLDTATQAEIAHLEYLVSTDPLTGLGNYYAYQEQLSHALDDAQYSGGEPLILAWLDIDDFKVMNDEQGHQRGDEILCRVATLLREARLSEALFRLNADDFAMIIPRATLAEAAVPFQRLCEEVKHRFSDVTISIGLTWTGGDALTLEELQAQAALALAEAKRQGRHRVQTFEAIAGAVSFVPLAKRQAVRRLLSEGKMTVAFQPIWDLATGTVLAYEALTRPAAAYGLSGPQELFDIAEQMGRAHELDVMCVEKILARAADLPADALLFLNLTPQSLVHDLLTGTILLEAVVSSGLKPSRVVLEITERSIVNLAEIVQKAKLLRLMGFRIALDDAGAGNAGLEMLSQVAVDFVKIDRAVVANALTDPAAHSVFVGITTIAQESHIAVVAEGIENAEMLAFVQEARVPYAQGYLLGRPSETITQLGVLHDLDPLFSPDKTAR